MTHTITKSGSGLDWKYDPEYCSVCCSKRCPREGVEGVEVVEGVEGVTARICAKKIVQNHFTWESEAVYSLMEGNL